MSEVAIRAESLGKSYRIDHQSSSSYRTLRESLVSFGSRAVRRGSSDRKETIWALSEVSFEVRQGEALGIIGRNGAGKSTLLKILSRITPPTTGRAEVYGRLGSLLEVGTGFHSELTGRENIFLNGAILGMSRREIRARFDEIVAFAETERFLDTPVKRYSSGMYMRLAFAVAAHLRTDILVVDEVLAVGDAEFQAKCLGKMEDVAGQGRAVLFVSHNMAAIMQLCDRALLLDAGRVEIESDPQTVISRYLAGVAKVGRVELMDRQRPAGTGGAMIMWAELRGNDGLPLSDFSIGDDITIAFGLRLAGDLPGTKLAISLRAADGTPLAHIVDDDSRWTLGRDHADWHISVTFRDVRFYPGAYLVSIWVNNTANTEVFDHAEDCLEFRIVDGGVLTMRWLPRMHGFLFLTPEWNAQAQSAAEKGVRD